MRTSKLLVAWSSTHQTAFNLVRLPAISRRMIPLVAVIATQPRLGISSEITISVDGAILIIKVPLDIFRQRAGFCLEVYTYSSLIVKVNHLRGPFGARVGTPIDCVALMRRDSSIGEGS